MIVNDSSVTNQGADDVRERRRGFKLIYQQVQAEQWRRTISNNCKFNHLRSHQLWILYNGNVNIRSEDNQGLCREPSLRNRNWSFHWVFPIFANRILMTNKSFMWFIQLGSRNERTRHRITATWIAQQIKSSGKIGGRIHGKHKSLSIFSLTT